MKTGYHAPEAGEWFDMLANVLTAVGAKFDRVGTESINVHRPLHKPLSFIDKVQL